jgi:hypothetical protein
MQKINLPMTLPRPWEDPAENPRVVNQFLFQEMGFYGVFGMMRLVGAVKAIHHPDAELALMNMMNKPADFVRSEDI